MGKPLSAAHKAAISRSLKARNGGGNKIGGSKLGGRKLSNPASDDTPDRKPVKPSTGEAPDRNARRRERRSERNTAKAAEAPARDEKLRSQVLKSLNSRGSGTFDRKQIQGGLDITPRDFNRAIQQLRQQGAISTSQRRISVN